jgi:hypothetical protein
LELNEGFIYLSQWQNHIDEDMEQQQQVGMQLGQGRGVSRLLVQVVGWPEQHGVWVVASLVVGASKECRCTWSAPAGYGKLGTMPENNWQRLMELLIMSHD